MIDPNLNKEVRVFATEAHKDQKRRKGDDYINHPIAVAKFFEGQRTRADVLRYQAALLHDVVEDTDVTLVDIHARFGLEVANVVDRLTKRDGEIYLDYLMRLSEDLNAVYVKIADINDNLSDQPKGTLADKYMLALHILWDKRRQLMEDKDD